MSQSSRKPHYAVVGFKRARGGIAVERAIMAQGEKSALRLAEKLCAIGVGAVAFSRIGDPEFDDFDEPVVIGCFGDVPENLDDIMR